MRNGSRNSPIGSCDSVVVVTRSVIVSPSAMVEEEGKESYQEQAEQTHTPHHSATIYHCAIHHSLISFFGLPLPSCLVDSFLAITDIDGPCALDEGKHGPDLRVGQYAVERRHVALVAFRGEWRLDPKPGKTKQLFVRVVPGVTGLVVRWRRQFSIGLAVTPIGLTFQFRTMAIRAIRPVDRLSKRDQS